jgi:ABC-type transport system involved in Fe-S cluster assembly fused permease/ATPase subunit
MISLVMRFYDPLSGEVLLDGKNVKDLNVGWLRCVRARGQAFKSMYLPGA